MKWKQDMFETCFKIAVRTCLSLPFLLNGCKQVKLQIQVQVQVRVGNCFKKDLKKLTNSNQFKTKLTKSWKKSFLMLK